VSKYSRRRFYWSQAREERRIARLPKIHLRIRGLAHKTACGAKLPDDPRLCRDVEKRVTCRRCLRTVSYARERKAHRAQRKASRMQQHCLDLKDKSSGP